MTKTVFGRMLSALEKDYASKHLFGGKPPKLSVLDKLGRVHTTESERILDGFCVVQDIFDDA